MRRCKQDILKVRFPKCQKTWEAFFQQHQYNLCFINLFSFHFPANCLISTCPHAQKLWYSISILLKLPPNDPEIPGSHGPKHQFCFQIQGERTVSNNESLSHCCNHLNTLLTDVFMVSGSFPVGILESVALLVHSCVQTLLLLPKEGPSGGFSAGTSPPHAPGSVLSFIQTIFSVGDFLIDTGILSCPQTLVVIYSPPTAHSTSSRFSL